MRDRCRDLVALALSAVLVLGCSAGEPGAGSGTESSTPEASGRATADPPPADSPGEDPTTEPRATGPTVERPVRPVSVPGLAEQRHRGDRLRLGAVRERTAEYTSYDMTYRSRSTTRRGVEAYTISGVINVPRGRGPFPAVVLAHGYIDPDVYVRGQGMTRERGYLAARGHIAMHVDYRNHAESDDDPRLRLRMELGYSADVINAVKALRNSRNVPVDDERVAMFGRSMGGGVVLKALIAEPGLVQAATLWASVSSLEGQNYDQFERDDPEDADDPVARRYGTPEENPAFWRANSARPHLDRITEPVLAVHGRFDDTCPPRWARATHRALTRAGVDSTLEWYDDGHAFGPAFNAAMDRTVRFLDRRLG